MYSRFNRPKAVVPPIGDGTSPVFEEVFENGYSKLVVVRRDNLFDFVQASKADTLVYNIISRYQRGDLNALNQRFGQFMDVVGMPTNLAEAYATMIDVQRKFDMLDSDLKAKFDNNVNVFVSKVSTATADDLRTIFGVSNETVNEQIGGVVDVA